MWRPDRNLRGPDRPTLRDIEPLNRVFADAFTDRYSRDGLVGVRVGAHGTQHRLAHGVRRGAGAAERRVGELAPLLGVAHEVVGERGAGAEHAAQPHGRALVVGDLEQHRVAGALGPLVEGVDEPQQPLERGVGVRARRELRGERRAGGAEALDALRGGGAVDEALAHEGSG